MRPEGQWVSRCLTFGRRIESIGIHLIGRRWTRDDSVTSDSALGGERPVRFWEDRSAKPTLRPKRASVATAPGGRSRVQPMTSCRAWHLKGFETRAPDTPTLANGKGAARDDPVTVAEHGRGA